MDNEGTYLLQNVVGPGESETKRLLPLVADQEQKYLFWFTLNQVKLFNVIVMGVSFMIIFSVW
jgi:hypothetical protein